MDDGTSERDNQYEFVPEYLRHHFRLDFFGGDEQEKEQIRRARRTRSAYLVSSSLSSSCVASTPAANKSAIEPKLYMQSVEQVITSRMTFDRTLVHLGDYFKDVSTKLHDLEETEPVVLPQWLYDGSVKLPTLLQVQRHIIQAAESCLSESDIYLAMIERLPGPPAVSPTPLLRFAACSTKSSMIQQVLLASIPEVPPHSKSQSNQEQHEPLSSSPKEQAESISFEVMKSLREVIIDDIEAYSRTQIRRFTSQTSTGPFGCFPLLIGSGQAAIGVLSLDSCRKALRLRPESMTPIELSEFLTRQNLKDAASELRHLHFNGALFLGITERDLNHKPMFKKLKINTRKRILALVHALKNGAMIHLARPARYVFDDPVALKFLHSVSTMSGVFLEGYRGVHWHRIMAEATRDSACSVYDAYDVLLRGIAQSVDFVERIVVWKIEKNPEVEIEVVASTQVPDDRLIPFLQWVERQIKHVVLYKESSDVHTSLVQGTILRIISPQTQSNDTTSASTLASMCEAASYQVSWSNRTVERLTWPQLRQLLPIRKMNKKHFQLVHLLERLENEYPHQTAVHGQAHKINGHHNDVIRLTNSNAVVLIIQDSKHSSATAQYALQVDFTSSYEIPERAVAFLRRAVAITEKNIACVRGRVTRGLSRQQSSVKVSTTFHSMGLNPSADALRALDEVVARVFNEITDNLPGVQAQIAELQPDGSQLRYTFTFNGSTLLGKVLNRGQGVSFRCLDSKQPLIVRKDSDLRCRLRRFDSQREPDDTDFPYVFLPLVHEDCLVGVISVNRFADVPKGREDENQPEAGVVEYLASLTKTLGAAIYLKRRSVALYKLQSLTRESIRSPHQLLFYALRAVKDTLIGAWKVRIVEIDSLHGKTSAIYELSEAERAKEISCAFQYAMPIRFRIKEMLPDSIMKHFNLEPETYDEVLAIIDKCDETELEDFKKLSQLEADREQNAAMSMAVSEKRRLQEKKVATKYFNLMLSNAPESNGSVAVSTGGREQRLSNEKYVNHAMKVFLGNTTSHFSPIPSLALRSSGAYITSSNLPQFHAACEQNYVARVADTLSSLMDELHQRIERSRTRVEALESFRATCEQTRAEIQRKFETDGRDAANLKHPLTPDKELLVEGVVALQQQAIDLLENIFYQTNVYVGLLEPGLRLLRYTSASKSSIMKGKQLKHGHGVSFQVLESQVPAVIAQKDAQLHSTAHDDTAPLINKVRMFAKEPMKQKWPFIAVPIGRFGVLGLDNLEKYERIACEPQPEIGVVDFLRQIASQVANVMEFARKSSKGYRQSLRTHALTRIMTACDDLKSRSPMYLQHIVIQEIERALNGVDAYIGMIQPLCEKICFACASSRSCMENQVANTTNSASFRVFVTQRPLVLPRLEKYYEHQLESDITMNGKLKNFGSKPPHGSYVSVPIPFVGVLVVDTFPGAASGIYTPHFPERGVVEFLSRVANLLGEHIRVHLAMATAKYLPEIFQGNKSTFPIVFEDVARQIASNLVAVEEIHVLRITSELGNTKPPLAVLKRSQGDKAGESGELTIDVAMGRILKQIEQQHSTECSKEDTEATRCFIMPDAPEVIVGLVHAARDVEDDTAALTSTAIVLRRVKGATWMYDLEFLRSILPLLNDLIAQVNARIEGIVARRVALQEIDRVSHNLEQLRPDESMEALPQVLKGLMEHIAQAMSRNNCDVYMGERTIGGEKMVFTSTSAGSLMKGVNISLSNEANRSLVSVQCLEYKRPAVIHLLDGKNDKALRALTDKKCQRVYMVEPMGDDRILCADSLGVEAFHPKSRRLEADITQFFRACATKLNEMILTTQYHFSYYQLTHLKSQQHPNFRLFFSTVLEIVRRDLVAFHSQQILTLANDFTGSYHVEAWHGAPMRRPLAHAPPHFCYLNSCDQHLISLGIHYEGQQQLPMTNLPRTLDESRSSLQPAEGIEKRGAYACSCLATMLDAQFVTPRISFCVFTHDAKGTSTKAETTFTLNQRQFFEAFAAVASDVFTHVYRKIAVHSFATEFFFYCRERLNAKDGLAVRVVSGANESNEIVPKLVVLFSSQDAKHPRKSVLQGVLTTKILQFYKSGAEIAIYARKRPEVSSPAASASIPIATTHSPAAQPPAQQTPPANAEDAQAAKQHGGSRSFFKRPDIFRSRKAKEQQKQAHPPQARGLQQQPDSSLSASNIEQEMRFHVLLRGVDAHGDSEIFSFDIEHQTMSNINAIEQAAKAIRSGASDLLSCWMKGTPRGDEEMLYEVLGMEAGNNAYHVSSGGGFYLLSLHKRARHDFQQVSLHLEPDIRGFLTGVQPTARDAMLFVRGATHDHKPATPELTPPSIFSEEESPALSHAAMVLVEAAMLVIGYKKEMLSNLDKLAMLKEYLRVSAGKKLLAVNPKEKKSWGPVLRAKMYLQSQDQVVRQVGFPPISMGAIEQTHAVAQHAMHSEGVPPHSVPHRAASASTAGGIVHAMWTLLITLISIVKYQKQLDVDVAREKRALDRKATVLQCFYRVASSKAMLKLLRKRFVAARCIQCAFRQHLARRRALFVKWTRAAIKIQRAYRLKLLRRKGSRPKQLSDELLAISRRYGGLAPSTATNATIDSDDGEWRVEMDAFGSFKQYLASKAGKEQLKREEHVMTTRMHELTKEREKLSPEARVMENVKDLFELLDTEGVGELSRDVTRDMMTRLCIPLTKDETDDVIGMMDNDHSGEISLTEFTNWFFHEYPLLKKRSRDCGVISRKDWHWVIGNSARSALRKRWRALRVGQGVAVVDTLDDGNIKDRDDYDDSAIEGAINTVE